jgi:CDGSH-type Zn-finger protein
MRPRCAQRGPYVLDVKAKNYAWCTCGLSQKQPYCDGAHDGTDMLPLIVKVMPAQTVAWCGCKATSTPPYCDGSHDKLP